MKDTFVPLRREVSSNKSSLVSNNELSFYDNGLNRMVIGYGSSVSTRALDVYSSLFLNLVPSIGVNGIYITDQGQVGLGDTTTPLYDFHVKKENIQLIIDSKGSGIGDSQIKLESTSKGLMGYDDSVGNQLILTDGEIPEIAGADLAIDSLGNVDIGILNSSKITI